MAKEVLTDAYISVGGNDISANVESVTLNYSADAPEITCMGDTTKTHTGGLLDWSLDLNLRQDFANAALDSILFPLVGTSVAIILRKSSGAVSTSNPQFTGSGIFTDYPPLGASVGGVSGTSAKIVAAGALARATA